MRLILYIGDKDRVVTRQFSGDAVEVIAVEQGGCQLNRQWVAIYQRR